MANVERHDFFPTCLYRFKHDFEENELDSMISHIDLNSLSEHNGQTVKRTGSQTQDDLQRVPTFSNLTRTITDVSKHILNEQGYMGEIEITNMWGNILRPQSQRAHAPHTHSNNFLSGVFYLKTSSDTSPIQFFDPRPQSQVLLPQKKEDNLDNGNLVSFPSVEGHGYVFPSWLVHWVPVQQDDELRISIAWNIVLRGEYGAEKDYQYARI